MCIDHRINIFAKMQIVNCLNCMLIISTHWYIQDDWTIAQIHFQEMVLKSNMIKIHVKEQNWMLENKHSQKQCKQSSQDPYTWEMPENDTKNNSICWWCRSSCYRLYYTIIIQKLDSTKPDQLQLKTNST